MSADAKMVPVAWHIGPIFKLGSEKPGRFGADDSRWQPLYSADTIASRDAEIARLTAALAEATKEAIRLTNQAASRVDGAEAAERERGVLAELVAIDDLQREAARLFATLNRYADYQRYSEMVSDVSNRRPLAWQAAREALAARAAIPSPDGAAG